MSVIYKQFFVTAKPGVRISVLDLGGDGPAVLLCSANGFHGLCYAELARNLIRCFHCYAIDSRGLGDSLLAVPDFNAEALVRPADQVLQPSASLPTVAGFAEDIIATAEHLHLQEVYLVGHSGGGCAALSACLKLPELVTAMYLYEPVMMSPEYVRRGGPAPDRRASLPVLAMKRRRRFPSKQAAYEAFSTRGFKAFHPAVVHDYVSHGFRDLSEPKGSGCELKCTPICEALVYANMEQMTSAFWEDLRHITAPVTVGCGANSAEAISVAADLALPLVQQLKDAKLERYAHLDHFGPFVDPDFVAQRILDAFAAGLRSKL